MMKKAIVILILFGNYISASEKTTQKLHFDSIIKLEQFIQTLPKEEQDSRRESLLKDTWQRSIFVSLYRNIALREIDKNNTNFVNPEVTQKHIALIIEDHFPSHLIDSKIDFYKKFQNLFIFELNRQVDIMKFIANYPVGRNDRPKFNDLFYDTFAHERSKERIIKELHKALKLYQQKCKDEDLSRSYSSAIKALLHPDSPESLFDMHSLDQPNYLADTTAAQPSKKAEK